MDKEALKRGGQVLAPSLFTMGNMACGFYSLVASSLGDFTVAGTSILGGIAFDMLDGRVARMVHGESSFGVEFDSLSDFLSFGVAPAYMMYEFTLKDYGITGGVVAFLFALCGALRLARFNVVAQSGKGSKSHFQGLPIPAGGGFLASFILVYEMIEQEIPGRSLAMVTNHLPFLIIIGPFLMVLLAFLMVSTIPYAAFKQSSGDWRLVSVALVGLLLIYFYPQNAIFLIFFLYVTSGLLGLLGWGSKDKAPELHH
ncbi:MAG: CDP-diacylglycerol--serine O-phosphatidyltransferase [Elusimicrobia bacterium]|nr:CDP-diacylglycerol--serine O-phosphatidyltransferase [Elusimicrobiota bacterium]